jgi:hypothetical protein
MPAPEAGAAPNLSTAVFRVRRTVVPLSINSSPTHANVDTMLWSYGDSIASVGIYGI